MREGFGIHRILLGINSALWVIIHVACVAFVIMALQDGTFLETIWFPLLLSVSWSALMYWSLYSYPEVVLEEKGVFVRILWKRRFYRWDEIKQAGILYHPGRAVPYERLYLVTPKGSKRRYKDKFFLLRNAGKLITLSAGKEMRAFVVSHYGPLDFDLSYGREEKSIVAD